MAGDALSILDCCMASAAAIKGKIGLPRTYQLLAATAADAVTYGPGQKSFTTALCDSLQELLIEADGSTFVLAQLCQRINTKRKDQACLPWDRLGTFKRTVHLGRLEQSLDLEDSLCNEASEHSSLYLRFSFGTIDLKDSQIERLAERLPQAFHEADVNLRRVDWVRMEQETGPMAGMRPNIAFETVTDSTLEGSGNIYIVDKDRFYEVSRTVSAVQKFQSAINRRRASKAELCGGDGPAAASYVLARTVALSSIPLLSTFGLLYFRRDKTGLFLWTTSLALMLGYGPYRESAWGPIQAGTKDGC